LMLALRKLHRLWRDSADNAINSVIAAGSVPHSQLVINPDLTHRGRFGGDVLISPRESSKRSRSNDGPDGHLQRAWLDHN
jgi:hypothetical protein